MIAKTLLFLTLCLVLPASAQLKQVEVAYQHPEKFTDAGRRWHGDAAGDDDLAELRRHIERRALPLLAVGDRLSVVIVDLDRAGRLQGQGRVVRDVDPGRIDLSFTLTALDGSVAKRGERSLRGLDVTGANAYRDDPLRYERALLDAWLERELRRAAQ